MDVVQREDFEAVKDMARLAREDDDALRARIEALEARLAPATTAQGATGPLANDPTIL